MDLAEKNVSEQKVSCRRIRMRLYDSTHGGLRLLRSALVQESLCVRQILVQPWPVLLFKQGCRRTWIPGARSVLAPCRLWHWILATCRAAGQQSRGGQPRNQTPARTTVWSQSNGDAHRLR